MHGTTRIKHLTGHSTSRYLVVGVSAFGADYALLLFTYYVVGLPLTIATSIGFFSGFAISFTFNKQWVFGGEQKKRPARQVIEYLTLLAFNYLFTVWAISYLNDHGLQPFIGKLVVMTLVMCWNYTLFRWVIFTKEAEGERPVP
jgi:putative flippase GtrA